MNTEHRNPAALQQGNPTPRSHGSRASQTEWQSRIAALRQGDKLPCFPRSSSATDAAIENRFTYGKARAQQWDFDGKVGKQPVSKAERRDKRQDSRWITRNFVEADAVRSSYPVAKQPSNRVAVWQGDRETRRLRVRVTDPITHEESRILVTLTTNIVSLLSYGQMVVFRHSNRMKGTYGDSRQAKNQPLSVAKSELERMLGLTDGSEAYQHLISNPAALSHGSEATVQQGS
jgi:hypothetical protein